MVGLDLWGGFHGVKGNAVGLSFCSRRPPKSALRHASVSPETSPSLSGIEGVQLAVEVPEAGTRVNLVVAGEGGPPFSVHN